MPHSHDEPARVDAAASGRWRPSRRALASGIVLGLLIVVLLAVFSDRTTARYWNSVHALALRADAVRNLDTPQEAIGVLEEIDAHLSELDPTGVDPRAVDAANRFRAAVASAKLAIDAGQAMLDHPIRTAAKSVGAMVAGKSPIRELHDRLVHVRDVTVEAYDAACGAHKALARRYPLSRFAKPIPPDVHSIDELLHELDRIEVEDRSLRERAFSIGRLLGAVAGLLLGV